MPRILIVEDNETFRQTLMNLLYLRFPSVRLEEAGEGEEALEKIGAFDPDIIFMDIKLPGETGLELTKKIRHFNSKVRIIILTNYDLPEYREAAGRNGADYFVSKGTSSADEILALVESILSKAGGPEATRGKK